MFEHNIAFNGMMIVIVILSYLLFKSLMSKKRLQHKYDEVFKAFHIANSEYTGGLKEVYKNLSLSNAQLQFLAVYLNQDTVQFDGRNIVCEKEDDVQYILSLISDSHFWLDKSMKGINEVVNNTDVIKDIKSKEGKANFQPKKIQASFRPLIDGNWNYSVCSDSANVTKEFLDKFFDQVILAEPKTDSPSVESH